MYESKTRETLYLMLKNRSPDLALGRSRARREELEQLLKEGPSSVVEAAVAPPPKRRRKPAPKAEVVPIFRVSQEAIDRTKRGLEMLEIAANAIKMSGMSEQQIGALLYVHCGLDAEQAGKAVMGLIGLRASLLGQAA